MRIGWRAIVSILSIAAVIGGSALVGLIADATGRDSAFVIDRFDREIDIEPDGTTRVTEHLDVTFSESRRGIFRDLPEETRFDAGRYEVIHVDQGSPAEPWNYSIERAENGDFRIRIGDAGTWLPPGTYRYRLVYLAPTWSHIRAQDTTTVETRIDVPGYGWPTSVGPTTLTVRAPGVVTSAVCVSGRVGTTERCPQLPQLDGNVLRAELGPFDDRESATLSFFVDRASFTATLPVFERDPLLDGPAFGQLGLNGPGAAMLIAVLLLLPLGAWSAAKARFVYRDRVTDPALHDRQHPTAIPAPPFGFRPPEVAGLLLRSGTNDLFLSTLVDLDQRGKVVSRTESVMSPSRALFGKGKQQEALVVFPPPPGATLERDERGFVSALLPGGQPTRFDGQYDSTVAQRVQQASGSVTARSNDVFTDHGFEHDGGALLRNVGFKLLVAAALLGFAVLVNVLIAWMTPLPAVAGGVVTGLTVVGYLIAHAPWRHHKLPLNSEGRDAVAQARAFEEFLDTVEGEQLEWASGQPGIDHHHPALSLLPYAIALGLADSWFKRFGGVMQQLAAAAGTGAAVGGAAWYTSQSSFQNVRSTQSATTTAPSSSGGGGGGGGSGGGGGGGGSW